MLPLPLLASLICAEPSFMLKASPVRETTFNYYSAVIISTVVLETFVESAFSRRRISRDPNATFCSDCGHTIRTRTGRLVAYSRLHYIILLRYVCACV